MVDLWVVEWMEVVLDQLLVNNSKVMKLVQSLAGMLVN